MSKKRQNKIDFSKQEREAKQKYKQYIKALNRKNKREKPLNKQIRITSLNHRRLKILAAKDVKKISWLADEIIGQFFKNRPL